MTDNPNGMRTAIPELEALGRSHPAMRPFVLYARAEHARICGNYEEALASSSARASSSCPAGIRSGRGS